MSDPLQPLFKMVAETIGERLENEDAKALAATLDTSTDTLYSVKAQAERTKPTTYVWLAYKLGLLQHAQAVALSTTPLPSDIAP